MCDDDERLIHPAPDIPKHLHDFRAAPAVQISGRLIRKDDIRSGDQCARDRHPLLLPAAQLVRQMCQAVTDAEHRCQLLEICRIRLPPVQQQRHQYILPRRQDGQQMKLLENKSDPSASESRQLFVIQSIYVLSIVGQSSLRGKIQT